MSDASSRLLPLAVVGEGALALAGLGWLYAAGHAVRLGATWSALAAGIAVAIGLSVIQWWLQRRAPRIGPVQAMRELQQTIFEPLVAAALAAGIVAIRAGRHREEESVRGAVQARSAADRDVAFGPCHLGLSWRGWVWVMGRCGAVLAVWLTTGAWCADRRARRYDLAARVDRRKQGAAMKRSYSRSSRRGRHERIRSKRQTKRKPRRL